MMYEIKDSDWKSNYYYILKRAYVVVKVGKYNFNENGP